MTENVIRNWDSQCQELFEYNVKNLIELIKNISRPDYFGNMQINLSGGRLRNTSTTKTHLPKP